MEPQDGEEEEAPLIMEPGDPKFPFEKLTEVKLPLIDSFKVSHDVTVFRFGFSDPSFTFKLPIGKHVMMSFDGQTENVSR